MVAGADGAAEARPLPLRAPLQAFALQELPESLASLADSIGRATTGLDPEAAAYQIGLTYTGMLPAEYRATYGIYYTPPILAERLIAQVAEAGIDWSRAWMLDPACGGGAFLAPVAQRVIEALPGCSSQILLKNIGTRLRGYETDPFGAWLSQVALDAVLLPLSGQTGDCLPVVVTVCDSLRKAPLTNVSTL